MVGARYLSSGPVRLRFESLHPQLLVDGEDHMSKEHGVCGPVLYLPGVVMNASEVDLLGAFVESSGVGILAFFPSLPSPASFLSSETLSRSQVCRYHHVYSNAWHYVQ